MGNCVQVKELESEIEIDKRLLQSLRPHSLLGVGELPTVSSPLAEWVCF